MADTTRDIKNKNIRRNEVEQSSLFAYDSLRGFNPAPLAVFCQQLAAHAHEGAEFAGLLSEQTITTRALRDSYQLIAEKASQLQTAQLTPEVDASLRLLLVRDLLAATEQEKTIHDKAMPANNADRLKKTALFVGGGLAAGLAVGLAGDVIGDVLDFGIQTQAGTMIGNIVRSGGLPTDISVLGLEGVFLDINGIAASKGIIQLGLNEGVFAVLGGVGGAALTAPGTIQGIKDDNAYTQSLNDAPPASHADQKLVSQGQTESLKQALALYNQPLLAQASAEVSAQASATPKL